MNFCSLVCYICTQGQEVNHIRKVVQKRELPLNWTCRDQSGWCKMERMMGMKNDSLECFALVAMASRDSLYYS